MAYIVERKNKKGSNFYLVIGRRINGKVKADFFPLGNKDPLPENMPRQNLPPNWIERLERKAKQRAAKPLPNPTLPEGKFPVVLADPPWHYDFDVASRATENHYPTLTLPEIINYRDNQGTLITDKFADNCLLFLWASV